MNENETRIARPAPRSGRDLLLLVSGTVLLALSLPPVGAWPFGLVALAPIVEFASGSAPARAFAGGFVAGLALHVAILPWVVQVMTQYGGLSWATACLVMLLMHAYLGCYLGTFSWLVARGAGRSLTGTLVLAPLLWAGLEWMRGWMVTGFPWIPLAESQLGNLGLLQHAEWGGVYTVSALVALGSTSIVACARPRTRRVGIAGLGVLALAQVSGQLRLSMVERRLAATERTLSLGVVQAMVPLDERWDPASALQIENRHRTMTADLARQGAQAVIWSESSLPIPGGFYRNAYYENRLGALAASIGVPILFGGTSREMRGGRELIFNSAFVIDARGRPAGRYDKQHLVPFGEYVPMQRYLFFADKLVREVGDFGRGDGPGLLRLGDVRVGIPICYEIIFPEISRAFVTAGAELLVTITNDAWFGRSAAPSQHFGQAVLRAVETRRFVVRCANTGISGVVAPTGRVEVRSALFEPALFVANVAPLHGETPYVRYGDVIAIAGFLLAAALALAPAPGARGFPLTPRAS